MAEAKKPVATKKTVDMVPIGKSLLSERVVKSLERRNKSILKLLVEARKTGELKSSKKTGTKVSRSDTAESNKGKSSYHNTKIFMF